MRMYDLIKNKRDGKELSKEEINYFINGMMDGSIPDYQVSALLMAIYFKHMNYNETLNLTIAMAESGDVLKLDRLSGAKVDKHSTGGVGDKTSLVLGPMVAACGVKVAKMSGRGLGHTGGTIDKLESFAGFNTSLSEEMFISQINSIGMAITGQTGNLAPADKKLYALRDVTATVDNISLIASSIMSKKLASGADAIVLDVKTGSGAFMKSEEDSFKLAKVMVDIGNGAGRKTVAVVTDMNQPLGFAVGNSLEVIEAIETLKGRGPKDLTELCLVLGTYMLVNANLGYSVESARAALEKTIEEGTALKKLCEFVEAQGGDVKQVYDYESLPTASYKETVFSDNQGFVSEIQSEEIGRAAMILGGGRTKKGEDIDLSVGIVLRKKVCDEVFNDTPLAVVYSNDKEKCKQACDIIKNAFSISRERPESVSLIKGIIE